MNELKVFKNSEFGALGIGGRIKQARKKQGLTQLEFSKEVCISQPHLSCIERNVGKPSKALVKLISVLFGVDEAWLISGKGCCNS